MQYLEFREEFQNNVYEKKPTKHFASTSSSPVSAELFIIFLMTAIYVLLIARLSASTPFPFSVSIIKDHYYCNHKKCCQQRRL
uniref:Ovule protein n=1 Tax=Caenorhabditis tropicalis TaxID=1561998 RepID=A0A1I7TIB7_9PELO